MFLTKNLHHVGQFNNSASSGTYRLNIIFMYGDTGGNSSDTATPDHLGANFQKIAEAAAKAITDEPGASDGEFASAISQTLKNLSEGAENLQVSDGTITNMD
jgi:hypothetical protein